MTIEWNPYPETKPPKTGRYLICSSDDQDNPIQIDEYIPHTHDDWFDTGQEYVLAWAELPEPYEKPIRLKAYPIGSAPIRKNVFLIKGPEVAVGVVCGFEGVSYPWTHWAAIPEFDFVEEE